jgi:hypothetical protein
LFYVCTIILEQNADFSPQKKNRVVRVRGRVTAEVEFRSRFGSGVESRLRLSSGPV